MVREMEIFSSLPGDFNGMSEFDPLTPTEKCSHFQIPAGLHFLGIFTSQHCLLGGNN